MNEAEKFLNKSENKEELKAVLPLSAKSGMDAFQYKTFQKDNYHGKSRKP